MLIAAAIGMRCYADAVRTPAEFDFTHFETTIMQVLHLSRLLDPTAAPVAVICYVLYLYPKGHRYGAHSTTTQCMLFDARNSDDVIATVLLTQGTGQERQPRSPTSSVELSICTTFTIALTSRGRTHRRW